LAIFLEVAGVLVHRNVYYASKDSEHLVIRFKAFFKFQKLVPEWMSQEIKANTACAALKEPVQVLVSVTCAANRRAGEERVEEGKHGICVCM
jgi:hypothetical protein